MDIRDKDKAFIRVRHTQKRGSRMLARVMVRLWPGVGILAYFSSASTYHITFVDLCDEVGLFASRLLVGRTLQMQCVSCFI